jgi:pyruvate/2-oxoglutarate dehydrogenase complex dihydrolipoamide dehydrogenase (E3) component
MWNDRAGGACLRTACADRAVAHDTRRPGGREGETQGFMKVPVDADSKEFLGATILGTGGDEVIHCVLDMMYARAPCTVMQWAMHIHPTLSELIPTMLDQLRPLKA